MATMSARVARRTILPQYRESQLMLRHEKANRGPWSFRKANPGWQIFDASGEVVAYVPVKVDAQLIVDFRNEFIPLLEKLEQFRKANGALNRDHARMMNYAWRKGLFVTREELHASPPLTREEAEALSAELRRRRLSGV